MDLSKYLKNRDFTFFLCTGALAAQVLLVSDTLTTSLFIPIIDKYMFNNNIQKISTGNQEHLTNNYQDNGNVSLIVEKNNIKFDVGKILQAFIRLIIVIFILAIIYKMCS